METTFQAGFKSIQDEIGTKFAQLDATTHKSQSDTVKWVAGVVFGGVTISISVMAFLLNNSAQKSSTAPMAAQQPIVIYAQPAPAVAPPPPAASRH